MVKCEEETPGSTYVREDQVHARTFNDGAQLCVKGDVLAGGRHQPQSEGHVDRYIDDDDDSRVLDPQPKIGMWAGHGFFPVATYTRASGISCPLFV